MRRLLTLSLIALFSVSAVATAATPKSGAWKGTQLTLGSKLKFTVSGGKIKRISANVLADCDGQAGETRVTFAPSSSWTVKGGSFSGRHKETLKGGVTAYFTFKGHFNRKTTVKGKLRYESIVAGSKCDTYDLDFKAKKR